MTRNRLPFKYPKEFGNFDLTCEVVNSRGKVLASVSLNKNQVGSQVGQLLISVPEPCTLTIRVFITSGQSRITISGIPAQIEVIPKVQQSPSLVL